MGTFALDTPILLANGYQITLNVASGTCNGAVTVDATKISIALTSEGYNSSGVLGTIARTITVASATVSGSTLTCNLSEPIYNDDTAVSITLAAAAFTDVTPDTSEALGSTSVDIATTPSTLDYALHSGIHFIDPPHQRYTGTTFDMRALGLHQYGWAAVKMGITRQLEVTTDASGIVTASLQYPDTITFSGGAVAVVAPGSDLTVGAGAKVVRVFLHSGTTPAAAETATCATSTGTFTVASTAGGGETSGFATFTTRTRDGTYGPAATQDVWKYTVTPPAVDRYERWFIFYPSVGDTSWDSRSLSVRSANTVMTGDSIRGEWEIYCDPGDTLSALQKSYYVDTTTLAAASGGTTGTFGQFEFCKNVTAGTLSGVVVAIGDNSAGTQSTTTFRYNSLPTGVVAYTVDQTGNEPTGIVYGDIIAVAGTYGTSTLTGFVLEYNATTKILTYLLTANTAFTAASSMATYDRDGVSRSITFTLGTPAAAGTTAPANGDVITGYSSGATCTLDGVPAANGSDSNTGTSLSPFLTQQKALKQASTDRGDSLGDGVTIYLKRGIHKQVYTAGNVTETRDYWALITKAPGIETDNVRITRYNTAATSGNDTNFEKFYEVTFWNWSSTAGVNILTNASNGAAQGSYDRKSLWIDSCETIGFFRWGLGQVAAWVGSNGPFYSAMTNSRVQRGIFAGHLYRDVAYATTANDTTTQGRCIVNVSLDDVSATGTNFHSDIWQGQGNENGNLLIWGLKAINLENVQIAPFINSSAGTVSLNSFGFANLMQAADNTANIPQVGNTAAGSTVTLSGWTWVDCVYPEVFKWVASAVGRNLTLNNLRMACSVWTDIDDVDSGTISGIYAGSYYNNHHVSAPDSGTYNPYTDTTTTTFADLFTEASDNDAAGFLVPKAASVLLDRSPASARPNGWPTLDVYGRLRSTDAAAQASIGAAQPIPELTVTYDGDAMSDGGTVSEAAGSKDLVMTVGGPTGAVAYISDVALGGTVSGTDASPYTLTSGGTTDDATITTTLAAGAGTVDISWDLSSVFDFDITGSAPAGGGFRARSRGRGR